MKKPKWVDPRQLPMFPPDTDWKPPAVADLPDWGSAKRVCVDTETFDPHLKTLGPSVRRGGYIAGYCIAIEGGPSVYAPVRHRDGGNMELEPVQRWMKDCARRFSGELVGMHLQYDLDHLWEEGIDMPNVHRFRDVMVAGPLVNELEKSYSLKAICARLGIAGKRTDVLDKALQAFGLDGGGIHALHSKYVGAYGEGDVDAPLQALRLLEIEIQRQGLEKVWELESRVLPVLVKMRRRGVRVNLQKLEKIENWAKAQQVEAMDEANRHLKLKLGMDDITRADAVGRALFESGVYVFETEKTKKYKVDKHFLKGIDHPSAPHLRRAKQMATLRSTFCESVRRHAIIAPDGSARIHTTFNQLRKTDDDGAEGGAAYGRLSSENLNMQNQPARDEEIGPMWRDIYEPEPGSLWASKDYSQQEPRVAVHLASQCLPNELPDGIGAKALAAALEAQRQYREDPTTDFHDMMTRMIYGDLPKAEHKVKRKFCKEIFLGLSYGMGGPKLCRQLGLPTKQGMRRGNAVTVAGDEGQRLMDEFDERVPFVRQTAKFAQLRAEQHGFIRTIGGRRCRFRKLTDQDRAMSQYQRWETHDWTHKAFNRAVQGGAADQTKHAVVALDEAGAFLQLQVHDELDSSVESVCKGREYANIMIKCFPLSVPSKVDLELGHSWGTAIGVDEWERKHGG